jgi:hypothetical protein
VDGQTKLSYESAGSLGVKHKGALEAHPFTHTKALPSRANNNFTQDFSKQNVMKGARGFWWRVFHPLLVPVERGVGGTVYMMLGVVHTHTEILGLIGL